MPPHNTPSKTLDIPSTPGWPPSHRITGLDALIWQLAHLVSATTNGLATTLSFNALMREAHRTQLTELVEIYTSSWRRSKKGLAQHCDLIRDLRLKLPSPDCLPPTSRPDHELLTQAYTALMCAAHECRQLPKLLSDIENRKSQLPSLASSNEDHEYDWQILDDGSKVKGVGWPQCVALGCLRGLVVDLTRLRDDGIDAQGIGWKEGWKVWSECMDP